jgi:hypothetical protein
MTTSYSSNNLNGGIYERYYENDNNDKIICVRYDEGITVSLSHTSDIIAPVHFNSDNSSHFNTDTACTSIDRDDTQNVVTTSIIFPLTDALQLAKYFDEVSKMILTLHQKNEAKKNELK